MIGLKWYVMKPRSLTSFPRSSQREHVYEVDTGSFL